MTYHFGDFSISPIVERVFHLDGGQMFGVVPKKIWGRLIPVDERNLIPMRTVLYVIRAEGVIYLIDTGLGDCLSDAEQKIYGAFDQSRLDAELATLGLTAHDIEIVLLTHLHTDHIGGGVRKQGAAFTPTFPRATYYVQKRELDDALAPDERSAAAYGAERIQALVDAGALKTLDGTTQIAPGVKAVLTGGHTAGHQGFEFSSGGETVADYCDIIPFPQHVRVPYVAATDLYPMDTMRFKRGLVRRLIDEKIVVAFAHDHAVTLARVHEREHKVIVEPLVAQPAEE